MLLIASDLSALLEDNKPQRTEVGAIFESQRNWYLAWHDQLLTPTHGKSWEATEALNQKELTNNPL